MSQNEIYMKFTDEKERSRPLKVSNGYKFNETIEIFEVSPAGDYVIINFKSNHELKIYKTSDWEEEPLGSELLEIMKNTQIQKRIKEWSVFVKWTHKGIYMLIQNKDNFKQVEITFFPIQLNERFHPNSKFKIKSESDIPFFRESNKKLTCFYHLNIKNSPVFVFVFEMEATEIKFIGLSSENPIDFSFSKITEYNSSEKVKSIISLDSFSSQIVSISTDSSIKIIMCPLNTLNRKSTEITQIKEIRVSKMSCFNYDGYSENFVMGYSDGKILSCPSKFIFLDITVPFEEISNIILPKSDYEIDRVFSFDNKILFLSNNTVCWMEYPTRMEVKSEKMQMEIFDDFKKNCFRQSENTKDCLEKFKFLYFIGETIWMQAVKENNFILKELLDAHLKLMKNIDFRNLLALFEFEPQYYMKEKNKNNKDNSALLDYILKDSPSKTQLLILDSFSSSPFTLKFREEIAQDFIRITGDISYIMLFDQIRKKFQPIKEKYEYKFIMNDLNLLSLTNGNNSNLLLELYFYVIRFRYCVIELIFTDEFVHRCEPIVDSFYSNNQNLMIKYSFGLVLIILFYLIILLLLIIEKIFFLTIHLTLFLGESALTLLLAPDRIKNTILKYARKLPSQTWEVLDEFEVFEGTERIVKIIFISAQEADRIFDTIANFPQSHAIFQSEVLSTLIEHRWENETKYIFFRRTYLYLLILAVISIDILYLFALRPSFDNIGQFNVVINMILNGSIIIHEAYMFWEEQTEMKYFYKYITNIWNILDIILIYSGIFSMSYDLYNLITFNEPDKLLKYAMALFFFLAWFRFLEYLRGIKATSTLLTLLSRVGIEMYGFLFVLLFLIAGLAFTCFLLQSSYDQNNPWDMFQFMYFLLLGDFDGYHSLYREQTQTTSEFYRSGFFLIFFISTIFIVIVMLNLLIAIISDAYEKVMLDIKSNETYETLYLINQERNKNSNPKGREEYFERMRNRRIIYLPEQQEEGSDSKDRVRTKITRIEQKLKEQGEEYNRKHLELTKANTEIISANTEIKGAIKRIEEQISKIVENTK